MTARQPTEFADLEGDISDAALMAGIALKLLEHVQSTRNGCLIKMLLTDQESERLHFALSNTFARIKTVESDFLRLLEGGAK